MNFFTDKILHFPRSQRVGIATTESHVVRENVSTSRNLSKTKFLKIFRLFIIATLPALIVIGQNIFSLVEDVESHRVNKILQENVKLSVKLGKVMHQIQIERGTTALFVSTKTDKDRQEVGQRLSMLYVLTETALSDLTRWQTYSGLQHFQSRSSFSAYVSLFRAEVQSTNKTLDEVLEFYSDINIVISKLVGYNININVPFRHWTELTAYELLLYGKEQAGIERALGSTYFARGILPKKDLLHYTEKRILGQHFLYRSMMNSDFVKTQCDHLFLQTQLAVYIDTMRDEISQNIAQNPSAAAGIVWFDNMTEYINILEVIQDSLARKIVQHAVDENQHVENTLVACIVQLVIAIVTVPIILLLVKNIVDISSMLEKKKLHLEAEKQQTELLIQKLEGERKRTEELLYQLLPKSVAKTIMENGSVEPESYNAATIMFSDVVGFTRISSFISPMQVVAMLNGLYMTIDERLEHFDVYKVETIGDGYMVASGLPKRNGDQHVIEVARLALDLLYTLEHVEIEHLREIHLQLRIGFHTGPCVAGVVGIRMPRYCIFGDTVNTASRMESTGLPMQIQMTKSSAKYLRKRKEFQIRQRGQIEVKGKGLMTTYWLLGYIGETKMKQQTMRDYISIDSDNSHTSFDDKI